MPTPGCKSCVAHFGRYGHGAHVRDDVLLVEGSEGSTGSYAHAAFRLSAGRSPPEVIELARDHATRCRARVVLWTRLRDDADLERAARESGLAAVGGGRRMPGMLTSVASPSFTLSEGCRVRQTRDAPAFAAVVAEAYRSRGVTPKAASSLLGNPQLLAARGHHALVALCEGEPVACALAFVEDGIGVLSWIGTVRRARRRGFGAAVTTAATEVALAHGARVVTLQTTDEGQPLYQRLGFQEVTSYGRYLVEPSLPR